MRINSCKTNKINIAPFLNKERFLNDDSGSGPLLLFGLYRNDMKKTSLTIKETLQRNQKHDLPVEFLMDNRRLTNPDKIANEFNAYFINIGCSIIIRSDSVSTFNS